MAQVRITIDDDDRRTRRVVETLTDAFADVEVRDARDDPDAADYLDRLVCCGSITPVVDAFGLTLTAPNPAEALIALRRAVPASTV